MGTPLNWFEYPDLKSSYVTIAMKNVSITKESDWKLMAKFQTEWSLKFYEVFLPILKNYTK